MLTIKDFSNALYTLRKAKGFAATVIVTLGITLGSLVAMFNLNYQILAAPLPYAEEHKLVVNYTPLHAQDGSILLQDDIPLGIITDIYKQPNARLESAALVGYSYVAMSLRDKADSPKVYIAYTTPEYMQMFQMPMLHGRAFSMDEGVDAFAPVAILSEQIWRQHYQADPGLVGQSVQIGSTQYTVVGIAADHFAEPKLIGPNRSNDVWLPWDFNPAYRNAHPAAIYGWHFMLGKLNHPAERQALAQQLSPEINARYQDTIAAIPQLAGRYFSYDAMPLRHKLLGDSSSRTLWMLAAALVLLCIACANMINLMLARAVRQQRNMAIQAALGAQKKHLFISILAELILLMTAALAIALLVAEGCYLLLARVAADHLPRVAELTLNLPASLFALGLVLLLALLFAALISRHINYRALSSALQSSGKGAGSQISAVARQLLIVSQVTLAAVLLVACIQVLHQSVRELAQDVGFATALRYQIDIDEVQPEQPPENRQERRREQKQQLMEIRDLLRQHPAIAAAAVANYPPISFDGLYGSVNWLKSAGNRTEQLPSRVFTTDQHFLPLFNMALLQGRNFNAQEVADQSRVIIINQTLARQLTPDGNAVGMPLYTLGGAVFEVIGVVNDWQLADQYASTEPNRVFMPTNLLQGISLLIERQPGMTISKTEINQLMQQVSPLYRTAEIFSIEQSVMRVLFANYLAAGVTSALVAITLLLAAIGIYGVLSYSVQLRRFELGVRMAIGASPATILQQLLRETMQPVAIGLVIASLLLSGGWLALQYSSFSLNLSITGFALPLGLILLLAAATSLLSVWGIIRKPAVYALKGQ